MQKPKRIILVGHMGAGRALLGKAVADQLDWQFIDIYLGLERYMGRSLNDVVGKQSEEVILQYQADLLSHYTKQENLVITTDDTVILSPKIRELLSQEYVIYIKVDTQTQLDRMAQSSFPPFPLLSEENRKAFLNKLHLERDALYAQVAKLTIETHSLEADLQKIFQALGK
ncbi:MAG TPA: shikimate kinase [Gammaproteobacteria bacterium]|nr:shikimate kinase [Gammaproteobacteria bacterium]